VNQSANPELDAARRELQELYRQLSVARPFSWSRMGNQMQIARLKRRIATLEAQNRES
jgi:Lon protease-like protein